MNFAVLGKITKAAIKFNDKIYTGYRHSDIYQELRNLGFQREELAKIPQESQGFITESGQFLTRTQARSYGEIIGQVKTIIGYTLTSEDLWEPDGSPLTS